MLLMEHATALKGLQDHYVKINVVMEHLEKNVLRNVAAPRVTLVIISVESVSSVLMTHSETNVSKLVTVMRMEQLCALILMEDASVKQTGLEQNVI